MNIAARLEAEAPPGGIIVSRAVREAVDGRLRAKLHALGELTLKNIERPIRAFRVEWDEADWQAAATSPARHSEADAPTLALPDEPSIAVLPFENQSGDPEQEYFGDGITRDITTALSRFSSLFVIAQNSSFTYRGKVIELATPAPPRVDNAMVKALARAFRWRKLLETGAYGTIEELAAAEKINSSYVSRILRLTLLAPDIVEAILDGRQPPELTLAILMEPFPNAWSEQATTLQIKASQLVCTLAADHHPSGTPALSMAGGIRSRCAK